MCRQPLGNFGNVMRCASGHSFDRAREGYVNLLAAGHGKSKLEGDHPEMLRARQRVLRRGYFQKLFDEINLRASGRQVVVEAGCGVGYYIGQLAAARPESLCLGFDISKHALKIAARTYAEVTFFANDVKQQICMADQSADLLLNVFAPRNASEFARILKANGELLVAIPAADHLTELRQRYGLLHVDEDKPQRVADQLGSHFDAPSQAHLQFAVDIAPNDIVDLIRMTPNYWHAETAALDGCAEVAAQSVTMSFLLLQFHGTSTL